MKHPLAPIFLLLCGLALGGCADRQINAANVDETLAEFQNGTLQMNTNVIENGGGIFFITKYERLADAQDWIGLSKQVFEVNSGDDLGWFFLGLSAEKLGYIPAAAIYYQKSIAAPIKYCGPETATNDMLCGNLRLPSAAVERLNMLQTQG